MQPATGAYAQGAALSSTGHASVDRFLGRLAWRYLVGLDDQGVLFAEAAADLPVDR